MVFKDDGADPSGTVLGNPENFYWEAPKNLGGYCENRVTLDPEPSTLHPNPQTSNPKGRWGRPLWRGTGTLNP
jgi:hypothetical protein